MYIFCFQDCLHFSDITPQCPHPHPHYRHLVVKSGTTSGQHDIWSTFGSGWSLVRCTPQPITPLMSPALVEASTGQELYYFKSVWYWSDFGSGWPLVRCTPTPWLRHLVARSGTQFGPVDLSSDVPPPPQQWHLVAKSGTMLGPVLLSSGVHPPPRRGL